LKKEVGRDTQIKGIRKREEILPQEGAQRPINCRRGEGWPVETEVYTTCLSHPVNEETMMSS